MDIMVLGSGGREAAMAWKLDQEGHTVHVVPGNAGIAEFAACPSIEADNFDALLAYAKERGIKLIIVGPEAPLVKGFVDQARREGVATCGPIQAVAQAEGSKAAFKNLLWKHNIPTAPYRTFRDRKVAYDYIVQRAPHNIVIKADGLMGGKGVILPKSLAGAQTILDQLMKPGLPGETVVIEKRLFGPERSAMAITDGTTTHFFPFTRDHKRVGEGDSGPNTGGMGAYTLTLPEDEEAALKNIVHRVIKAINQEWGIYTGFIYIGFMMTAEGPMALECNCRLGDPETQAILASLEDDFAAYCLAVARGSLHRLPPLQRVRHAHCLVLASSTYPDPSDRDDPITGIKTAEETGALVLHAGTGRRDGHFTTNRAGRILNVVGTGDTIGAAQAMSYAAAEKIHFPDMKFRRDIGPTLLT